jgi:choline dehydrogenase-like flavoprotein
LVYVSQNGGNYPTYQSSSHPYIFFNGIFHEIFTIHFSATPMAHELQVDWGFRSVPQEHLLPRGRVIDLERGKTLGGSSAINYNMRLGCADMSYGQYSWLITIYRG